MICHIYDRDTGKWVRDAEGDPECGKDFCDECGDCLECYHGDTCEGGCAWVRYADNPPEQEE